MTWLLVISRDWDSVAVYGPMPSVIAETIKVLITTVTEQSYSVWELNDRRATDTLSEQ